MAIILGIGNTLLRDEGIGIHLMKHIKSLYPEWESHYGIEMIDGGTLSFDLLNHIRADQDLIVLDAVNLNQLPGTVYCLQARAMDNFLSRPGKTVHEVSLMDLFDMSRLTEQLPQKRVMIGIQPDCIDWGNNLSQTVEKALPSAAEHVKEILAQWGVFSAQPSQIDAIYANSETLEQEQHLY